MNREQKAATIENLSEDFRSTSHIILTEFRGLSVNQATALRRRVRAAGGRYRVVKNRLAKRAAAGTPVEKLTDSFTGPRAVAFHSSDPVALAKALSDFAKENPQLEIVAGLVDAKEVVDARGVKALAALPGLPDLRAKILSVLQAPASRLVRLLATPGTGVARALDARRRQLESGEGGSS